MRLIMALADRANPYVEERKPWELRKDPARAGELQDVCTVALNLFRQLVDLPRARAAQARRSKPASCSTTRSQHWDESKTPLVGTPVAKFTTHAATRRRKGRPRHDRRQQSRTPPPASSLQRAGVARLATNGPTTADALAAEPLAPECTIDDFTKVDLRVARIIAAEDVPEAKKLLKLTLSLGGDDTTQRLRRHQGSLQTRTTSSAGSSSASPTSPRAR